jgi:ABC-2 type transport system permease protein
VKPYHGIVALAEREVALACKHWATQLLGFVIVTATFVLFFGVTLGGRMGTMGGFNYAVFVVPGACALSIIVGGLAASGTAIWQARHDGYVDDVLCAPLRPVEVMLGYLLGAAFQPLVVAGALFALARILMDVPFRHPLLFCAALLLALALMESVGLIIGIVCRKPRQLQFCLFIVLQPLTYSGGICFSTNVLPPVGRELIRLDPFFYVVQAIRFAVLGTADAPILLSLAVTAGLASITLTVALWLFTTGRGLKS